MPKAAKPYKVDLEKIKADYAVGKFPFKIQCSSCKKPCGNSSMDIFNSRIKTYGSIDKLFANYVCTKCRKTKNIVPIKEVAETTSTNEQGVQICKEAMCWMPDGTLQYFWMHPLYNTPSSTRQMVETGDGYVTFVRVKSKEGDDNLL